MEIPLRGLAHVKKNTLKFIFKHWRTSFSLAEKIALTIITLSIIFASSQWAYAFSQLKTVVPRPGGTFIEGVVGSSLDNIDLGRLTKSGLVRYDENGAVAADIATNWEASADKLTYKFVLIPKVSSYEIADTLQKNPTYLSYVKAQPVDQSTINFVLSEPNASLMSDLTQPIFPYGPYKVDKKTDTEIRLIRNADYHLDKPFIDKFIVRLYPDQAALQKAADKNKINGALGLNSTPKDWQTKTINLSRRHMLFINSSKSYLKKTAVRGQLLDGQKPDGVDSLSILEVNGIQTDQEYEDWKAKLQASGVKLDVRKVAMKDAITGDLPQRNYDVLYILVSEGANPDPYLFWDSSQRSGVGQNFSEVADAALDKLVEQYRLTDDKAKQAELNDQINKLVADDKLSVSYKSLTATYAVSPKVKGYSVKPLCICESDRFSLVTSWHFYEKKQK